MYTESLSHLFHMTMHFFYADWVLTQSFFFLCILQCFKFVFTATKGYIVMGLFYLL